MTDSAKYSTLKFGMKLRAYGFQCLPEDEYTVTVVTDINNDYCFACNNGLHYIVDQLADDDDTLIGLDTITMEVEQ